MLIENSERLDFRSFISCGQSWQGSEQSYALATKENFKFHFNNKQQYEQHTISAIIRLKSMEETSDGFKISEIDLKLRGPGDFLGTKQAGLPSFKFINLASDGDIVSNARKLAFEIIAADPHLRKTENQMLREHFIKLYKEGNHYFDIA
jgi:ATP-dependent DNA helicase RecG